MTFLWGGRGVKKRMTEGIFAHLEAPAGRTGIEGGGSGGQGVVLRGRHHQTGD